MGVQGGGIVNLQVQGPAQALEYRGVFPDGQGAFEGAAGTGAVAVAERLRPSAIRSSTEPATRR